MSDDHPVKSNHASSTRSYLWSGAAAGAVSAFVFTIIHDLFISDIWFSVLFMMIAGAVCGLGLGWSYGLLFEVPSTKSWVRYNLLYVAMFGLLGAASVLVYEPVTTMAAVVAANAPPNELFAQAMPLTLGFTVAMALLVSVLYGRSWWHFGAILLTCTLLVLLLGLNVSAIGLVYIPSGSVYVIAELFGLIVALNVVYVAVFIGFERKRFIRGTVTTASSSDSIHHAV
ncbi:MAG: hypothetical protein HKN04_03470 [Rhodothermaceae bacterium]|nr:hypothetical protein [Rhodothermaceae bacterium]